MNPELTAEAAKNDFVIDVSNVTKSFNGKVVVNGIAMQVKKGEIYGIVILCLQNGVICLFLEKENV